MKKTDEHYPLIMTEEYWANSQKHKALFSSRKKAEDAVKWIDANIEIVEL